LKQKRKNQVTRSNTSATPQREKSKRSRRGRIVFTAAQLFSKLGYHAASTRRIASEAGLSEGTIFNHFKSKQEILIAILRDMYEEMITSAQEGLEPLTDTRERLELLALNHLQHISRDNGLLIRMIHIHHGLDVHQDYLSEESFINALNRRYTRLLNNTIKEGIRRGELIENCDLAVCRDLFFGGLEYGMRTLFLRGKKSELQSYAHLAVDNFIHGLERNRPEHPGPKESEQTLARLENLVERLEYAVKART